MKTIGLLGGMSWPSTMEYYKYLNKKISKKLGDYHSANILLQSIDYHEIKSRYENAWDEIPQLLKLELQNLAAKNPDMIILCNNTLHKALDEIDDLQINIPILHAGHLVAEKAHEMNMSNILFLGTKRTMENGYYKSLFEKTGLTVIIPNSTERGRIQKIQSKLATGKVNNEDEQYFTDLINQIYTDVDGIILGCTELPLAFSKYKGDTPILNTIHIQCDAAIKLALSE